MPKINKKNHRNARSCAVCGSSNKKILYAQSFTSMTGTDLLSKYDVVACQNCGFCFADNIPNQKVFDVYYKEMSKYEAKNRDSKPTKYDLEKFDVIAATIASNLQDKKTNILEIGCANAHLLSLLKKRGFINILGADPSPTCAKSAYQLYGIKVLTNTLSDMKIAESSIEFLILAGVLEHIRDLDSTMIKLNHMLSHGGRICVAVPDASMYSYGEDAPFQEFSTEHINFFGPKSLNNLMHKYGFSQMYLEQIFVKPSHNTKVPIINSIYRKDHDIKPDNQFILDTDTESGLVSYISKSRRADDDIHKIINKIVDNGNPVIIWGTGALALRLLAKSKLSEAKITAFVDSNPHYQGKDLNGIQIIAPVDLKKYDEAILIATRAYQAEIVHIIRNELRLRNELITIFNVPSGDT
jgi:2-polyprenyl-3-methyl-5-hydroxy-6-metoxy-1,4-benzoquinol methylase